MIRSGSGQRFFGIRALYSTLYLQDKEEMPNREYSQGFLLNTSYTRQRIKTLQGVFLRFFS